MSKYYKVTVEFCMDKHDESEIFDNAKECNLKVSRIESYVATDEETGEDFPVLELDLLGEENDLNHYFEIMKLDDSLGDSNVQ